MGQCKSTSRKMKVTLALLVILGIALVIEAVPQGGRRPGRRRPGDDSSEEDGGGRRGGGGRGKGGKGGLKKTFQSLQGFGSSFGRFRMSQPSKTKSLPRICLC